MCIQHREVEEGGEREGGRQRGGGEGEREGDRWGESKGEREKTYLDYTSHVGSDSCQELL